MVWKNQYGMEIISARCCDWHCQSSGSLSSTFRFPPSFLVRFLDHSHHDPLRRRRRVRSRPCCSCCSNKSNWICLLVLWKALLTRESSSSNWTLWYWFVSEISRLEMEFGVYIFAWFFVRLFYAIINSLRISINKLYNSVSTVLIITVPVITSESKVVVQIQVALLGFGGKEGGAAAVESAAARLLLQTESVSREWDDTRC